MIGATSLLILKQHRFSVIFFLVTMGAMAAVLGLAAVEVGTTQVSCANAGRSPDCIGRLDFVTSLQNLMTMIPLGAVGLPFFAAAFVGVPIVASEIEQGTAILPWTLGVSRRRWLLARVAVLAIVVISGAILAALATDALSAVWINPRTAGTSLIDHQWRGIVLVARVLFVFATALLAGALVGRSLPALLVTFLIAGLVVAGLEAGFTLWRQSEVRVATSPGSLIYYERFQDRGGQLYTTEEATTIEEWGTTAFEDRFRVVGIGIPAESANVVIIREAAIYSAVSLLLVAASLSIVDRRRPY